MQTLLTLAMGPRLREDDVVGALLKRVLLGIEHEEAPERNPFKKGAAAG